MTKSTADRIEETNQYFEKWSDTYESSYMQRLIFDRAHRAVIERTPGDLQPKRILDVGCGTGRLLRRAGHRWPEARLFGIDLTEGMVCQAHRLTPGAAFAVSQAEKLPLPDASLDLALSTVSFHHWADQAEGVRQVAHVLRPGGVFILADMAVPYWIWLIMRHGQFASAKMQRKMFENAGLSVLEQSRSGWGNRLVVTVGKKI